MPISINNFLPSINLNIGPIMDNENTMRMLVDTGAATNTVNKVYHIWVMSKCPSMVAEYPEYGTDTEYDVVQLLAALDLKEAHQPVKYGSMTAVIRCQPPYIITNTSLLILSVTLGNNVILRSVLSTSCLSAMCAVVDLVQGQLKCSELNQYFNLQLDPPCKGLSNLMVFRLMLHPCSHPFSTSSDGTIAPVSQQTYSNSLIVTSRLGVSPTNSQYL